MPGSNSESQNASIELAKYCRGRHASEVYASRERQREERHCGSPKESTQIPGLFVSRGLIT